MSQRATPAPDAPAQPKMLVLSLWQPWATLLVHGVKEVETRDWAARYRGEVAVHAAKMWDYELADLCNAEPFRTLLAPYIPAGGTARDLPRGAIIGRSRINGCYKAEVLLAPRNDGGALADRAPLTELERALGDYSAGRWGWDMGPSAPLAEPIPWSGDRRPLSQDVPPDLVARIIAAAPLPWERQ